MVNHYYDYKPSLAAAATFTGIFAILSIIHAYQLIRTKTWFWIPFLMGGIFEVAGFAARAANATETPHDWSFAPFVIQTLGILLAPVLFASSLYMILGRIADLANGVEKLLVKRKWLTKIFVLSDVLSFGIQVVGGVMLTQQNIESIDRGRKIILVGLWLQIVFFSFFIITVVVLWIRLKKGAARNTPWQKHLIVLLIGSSMVMARCIYRVVEYVQGKGSYLMVHEVFIYALDGGVMIVVMLIYLVAHPSEIWAWLTGGNKAVFLKIVTVEKPEKDTETNESETFLES